MPFTRDSSISHDQTWLNCFPAMNPSTITAKQIRLAKDLAHSQVNGTGHQIIKAKQNAHSYNLRNVANK